METHSKEPSSILDPQKGEINFDGKVFKYKTSPRKLPHDWLDLEITNAKGETIKVYFNPKRQRLQKEIKKHVRFQKWI